MPGIRQVDAVAVGARGLEVRVATLEVEVVGFKVNFMFRWKTAFGSFGLGATKVMKMDSLTCRRIIILVKLLCGCLCFRNC